MTIEFATRVSEVKPNAVGELLRMGSEPGIISFARGYPDASLFPRQQLDAVLHEAVIEHGSTSSSAIYSLRWLAETQEPDCQAVGGSRQRLHC